MGMKSINEAIGTPELSNQPIIGEDEEDACLTNCELVSEECDTFVSLLSDAIKLVGYETELTKCPLTYYSCKNNINILDKLLSGFYTGQELQDGVKHIFSLILF